MSDLLPCPFCGGKADIDYDGSVYDGTHVYCTECDIRTESYKTKTGSTWDVDAAIAAWNRRALPAVQPDAHVNEMPKSEHDTANMLTLTAERDRFWAALEEIGKTYPADASRLIHSDRQIVAIIEAALKGETP